MLIFRNFSMILRAPFFDLGMDVASNIGIRQMFSSFKRSYLPKVKPPVSGSKKFDPSTIQALEVVSRQVSDLENMFSVSSHISQKNRQAPCLSYQVRYSKGWRSCTFSFLPDFVAKTQNPSMFESCFKEFTVSFLADFMRHAKSYSPLSELSRGTSSGQSSPDLNTSVCSSRQQKGRNRCPKTPFCFGLISDFPHLPLIHSRGLQGNQGQGSQNAKNRYFTFLQKELCSPTFSEGWFVVIADNLCSLLPTRSPTGIWTPFPSALWWLLKRLCTLPYLMAPV